MSRTLFYKFWRILCYCIPYSKVYKKKLVKFKKMVKDCALNLTYRQQIKIVLFVIILQNMLLDVILNVYHIMGSW